MAVPQAASGEGNYYWEKIKQILVCILGVFFFGKKHKANFQRHSSLLCRWSPLFVQMKGSRTHIQLLCLCRYSHVRVGFAFHSSTSLGSFQAELPVFLSWTTCLRIDNSSHEHFHIKSPFCSIFQTSGQAFLHFFSLSCSC